MSHFLPYLFAGLAALAVGAIVISFWQSVRGALGLIGTDEIAEEAFAGTDRGLLQRRAAVLAALRELDFDHEAGKLSDEDHAEARARLRSEAKAVLHAIDEAVSPHRAAISALVDARLARTPAPESAEAAETSEASSEEAAKDAAREARICSACGTANDADAAFCKRCATALDATALDATAKESGS